VAGKASGTKQLDAIKRCLPELVTWINHFQVQTTSNNNGSAYWITSAYLDTSGQQISAECRKVLGVKLSTGE
jgi:hypothetical protein